MGPRSWLDMLGFGRNHIHEIGVDISRDGIRLAQLANYGRGVGLIAGGYECWPADLEPGSVQWQRWVVDRLHSLVSRGSFRGKSAKVALPSGDVYIESVKMPKKPEPELEDALFARIRPHMPSGCTKEGTLIKYLAIGQDNALVMASDRETINRYLAVYEKAGLDVRAIGVWPEALVSCYATFFGRRKSDLEAVVLLLNVEAKVTNLVIARHENVLFARSIPIGGETLTDEKALNRLVLEVTACRRDFVSMCRESTISRLIFLSGPIVETHIYADIAKQLEVQAQIGDCLVAVEMSDPMCQELDRRDVHVNWATAFGLSLS